MPAHCVIKVATETKKQHTAALLILWWMNFKTLSIVDDSIHLPPTDVRRSNEIRYKTAEVFLILAFEIHNATTYPTLDAPQALQPGGHQGFPKESLIK